MLTLPEQHALILKWQGLPAWVLDHKVGTIAKRMERDDAIQAGQIGLCEAARRFDPSRGIQFNTYAVWWVRQSIQQAAMNEAAAVRLPANMVSNSSEGLNDKRKQIRQQALAPTFRITLEAGEADELWTLPQLCTSDRDTSAECDLASSLDTLHPRLRQVIELRYYRFMSFKEIGSKLGVSKQRVVQLENHAIRVLQKCMGVPVVNDCYKCGEEMPIGYSHYVCRKCTLRSA